MTAIDAQAPEPFVARAAEWFDDRINPILLKDIRAWMRSKAFLIVYFVALGAAQLVTINFVIPAGSGGKESLGQMLFFAILFGLGVISTGIVPYLTLRNFTDELQSRSTELALISYLTPGQLVRGKILSGLVGSLCFFATVAPSIMIAYMIGGISLFGIAYTLVILLLLALVAQVVATMLVVLADKKQMQIAGLLFLIAGLVVSSALPQLCSQIDRIVDDPEFIFVNVVFILCGFSILAFFYTIAVSRLSFNAENRDTGPRIMLWVASLTALISLPLMGWIADTFFSGFRGHVHELAEIGLGASICIFGIGNFFLMTTTDYISQRVCTEWPRRTIVSMLFWPGRGRYYLYTLVTLVVYLALGVTVPRENVAFCAAICCAFATLCFGQILFAPVDRLLRRFNITFPRGAGCVLANAVWVAIVMTVYVVFDAIDGHSQEDSVLYASPITAFGYMIDRSYRMEDRAWVVLCVTVPMILLSYFFWVKHIKHAFKEDREIREEYEEIPEGEA